MLLIVGATARGSDQDSSGQPESSAVKPSKPMKINVPDWAREAKWYRIHVPRFYNGDPTNDPTDVLPWSSDWPATQADQDAESIRRLDRRSYGGDLQGLQKRLPYLKSLGVNALYLTGVFHTVSTGSDTLTDLRHAADAVGVKGSLAAAVGESQKPETWDLTGSDRLFLGFVREAHKQEMRVVVEARLAQAFPAAMPNARIDVGEYLAAVTQRWMDPNSDENPSDGLDGWVVPDPGKLGRDVWKPWRRAVRKINHQALLIADATGESAPWLKGDTFDVVIDDRAARAIRRFFMEDDKAYSLKSLTDELASTAEQGTLEQRLSTPLSLSSERLGRLLDRPVVSKLPPKNGAAGSKGGTSSPKPDVRHPAADRWRLAVLLQYIYPAAPMIDYGDEIGIAGGKGPLSRPPRWWADTPANVVRLKAYRGDFASLVQWLNRLRDTYPPLREGGFRVTMTDEANRILAVSRNIPGDEVVLVVNYGNVKQKVMLKAGVPGQLIGVLTPHLHTASVRSPVPKGDGAQSPAIAPLAMGGSRQYVNDAGEVRLWIEPMSARLVFVSDNEPH